MSQKMIEKKLVADFCKELVKDIHELQRTHRTLEYSFKKLEQTIHYYYKQKNINKEN